MNRRRSMTARDVVRVIAKRGGELDRERGSHRLYVAKDAERRVVARTTVPMHKGDLPFGTLRAIEQDMESAWGKGWLR